MYIGRCNFLTLNFFILSSVKHYQCSEVVKKNLLKWFSIHIQEFRIPIISLEFPKTKLLNLLMCRCGNVEFAH